MKLVPKIYLAFGSILLIFCFVTYSYVLQSNKVKRDMDLVLISAESLRLAEGMEKAIVDAETGVRGFLVSDNEAFLEPYYQGKKTYKSKMDRLLKMEQDTQQLQQIMAIDSAFEHWQNTFAERSIHLQRQALRHPDHVSDFEYFKLNFIRKGVGKKITDGIRSKFATFNKEEMRIRNTQLTELRESIAYTKNLSIALTIVSILIGFIVILWLANTIRDRLEEMSRLANEVAMGHFDVALTDTKNDEISQVSESLNVMAKRLNDSFTTLQKTNKELDQFAYVVSHDLKAPLRAINSLAEWIEEDLPDLEPDVQRNLELMRGRVVRMENLINGILDYARIGRKKLPLTQFSTAQLIAEITDSLSPAENVEINVVTTLPALTTEKILLQQVLANLISNAIKYNDKANPVINIGCQALPNGHEFWVSDNGPGIPAEYHQKVFGIFQTMEARDTRESTGIGLAIVKKIIDEKDGDIKIESEMDHGSTFKFFWPNSVLVTESKPYLAKSIA